MSDQVESYAPVDEQLSEQFLNDIGYYMPRQLPDGRRWVALHRMRLSIGMLVTTGKVGESYRYLYDLDHIEDAEHDVQNWDGKGEPAGLWIQCKGKKIYRLNPRWVAQAKGQIAEDVLREDKMRKT